MRAVALLSFYAEQPHELHRLIASLPKAGVTHLVALDGRYREYKPGSPDTSRYEAHEAIMAACDNADIGLTLHVEGPWDTEMAKRTFLFDIARKQMAEDEWWMVVDGDEEVGSVCGYPPSVLATTHLDVATVVMETAGGHTQDVAHRMWFRAMPGGITVEGNHYTYRDQAGRTLWGHALADQLEPAQPLRMLILHHERDAARRTDKLGYYLHRDRNSLEVQHVTLENDGDAPPDPVAIAKALRRGHE
jgi:hypothetical protein